MVTIVWFYCEGLNFQKILTTYSQLKIVILAFKHRELLTYWSLLAGISANSCRISIYKEK
jgi:hypothetical protein